MSNTVSLELRIHDGLHAGAHAPLPGQDACTVGADPACDFVLADSGIAPTHLRLMRDAAGAWTWETDGEKEAVVPGRLLSLGTVVVSLAEPDSPWPDAQAVAAAQRPAAAPTDEAAVAEAPPSPENDAPAAMPEPPPPAPPATAPAPTPGHRLSAAAKTAGVLLLCLAALLGAALWWLSTLQHASAAPLPAAAPADAAAQRAAIENVLRKLGLEDRATLSATPLGGWAVEAAALDEETLEALALALSRLDPKPGLRAASSEDARGIVQDALIRLSGDEANLTAVAAGDGRIRIEGTLADDAARSALLDRLRAELPAWLRLESAIALREERAQRLLAELQAQHPGSIHGQWSDSRARLEIVARVAADDVARWERALIQTAQRHPEVPFHARLERLPAKPPARLPFRVMTVVNGATDYVVLDDGSKLLLAGRRDGWQLVAVDAHEVVFENGRALRVSVPR